MLLIDGDHLFVYRVGFAIEDDPHGMNAARYNIEKSLYTVLSDLGDSKYRIFLTGKDNFRDTVATLFPYKGRRKERGHRPKYYQEIRDHLVQKYNAEIIDGMEADDALGIEQMKTRDSSRAEQIIIAEYPRSTIVASDKDLDMIPGFHYNPIKKEKYFVSSFAAYLWYSIQRLAGDWECDDIPGLKGIGTKTAQKLLSKCIDVVDLDMAVLEEYRKRIVYSPESRQYQLKLKGDININSGDSVEMDAKVKLALTEISQLVWIRRQ